MRLLPSALRTVAALALAIAMMLVVLLGTAVSPVAAQSDDPTAPSDTTVQTTSTLPTDNRQLGDSLPQPGQGREPQSAGDPGGWMQTSLFFLICAAILVIVGLVWRSSRRARTRRTAAGHDPVQLATARGEGLRPVASDATASDPT